MIMAYVKLILGIEDDNEKMSPLNYDMQFSSLGRLPTDKPVKVEILSMDRKMVMKTQVVRKTFQPETVLFTFSQIINELKEALNSFKDPGFKFVKQSANQVFFSLAWKVDSMSDCKECFFIPLNFVVNVPNYDE